MTVPGKGGAPKNQPKSAAHKAKISKAQEGKANSNYDKGQRLDYRKLVGAEKGDGKVVSHVNNNHEDNRKSNLKVLNDPPKKGTKRKGRLTTSAHEKHHAKTDPRK